MPQPQFNTVADDVVTQVRYESILRVDDVAPSICASVHDALWMLSQQWRVKEFKGEDAGSIVKARLETKSTPINRYKGSDVNAPVEAFDPTMPLETKVERLPLIIDLGLSLEIGLQWYKIMQKQGIGSLYPIFVAEFQIQVPTGTSDPVIQSNKDSLRARKLSSNRIMDGAQFIRHLVSGHAKDIDTFSTSYQTSLDSAELKFKTWLNNTYSIPENSSDNNWSTDQLEYQFSLSAPLTAAPATQTVLEANRYVSGTVDWYSVDRNPNSNYKLNETGPPITDNYGQTVLESYLTRSVKWKGMPKRRWWEFEDSSFDISKVIAQKQDIAKLVLVEFGLTYSNDWFIIPRPVDNATITEIGGLVVTDVFDQQFVIKRAGLNATWQEWDMFRVNATGKPVGDPATLNKLLMMPALIKKVESEPIEKVLFLRDEVSNMVWGVEEVVPNDMFGGVSGKDAANRLEEFLDEAFPPINPSTYTPNYQDTQAILRYKVQNSVPENWIPFIPSEQTTPDNYRLRKIQRARLFRYSENGQPSAPITPRTSILRVNLDNFDASGNPLPPGPYKIYQEEVSKSGFEISTNFQRTRWYNGKPFVWLGRKVNTGRGESGIRFVFDMLEDKESEGTAIAPTPPQLPVLGASGWYMADSGVITVGGAVDSWTDMSGSGNHLIAPSVVFRPPFVGSGGANNYPYLDFDGSRSLYRSIFNQAASQDLTIFAVFRMTDASQIGIISELSINTINNNNGMFVATNNSGSSTLDIGAKGDASFNLATTTLTNGSWLFFRCEAWKSKSSNECLPYINGGPSGSTVLNANNSNTFGISSPLYVGSRANSSFFLIGQLSQLIIYPKTLLTAEISSIETYLNTKYNILGTVPQIPAPDAGWWMANAGVTTSGGNVSNWIDQSGVGNHFTAATSVGQPIYSASGGAGNMPYLNFTGSQALYVSAFNIPSSQDLTFFVVCKSSSSTAVGVVMEMTANTNWNNNGMFIVLNDGGSNTTDVGAKGDAGYSLGRQTLTSGNWVYLRAEAWKSRPSGEAVPYVSGSAAGSNVINNNNTNTFGSSVPLYLGSRSNSSLYMQGQISEIIIYARSLTPAEISTVENYLKAKYSL